MTLGERIKKVRKEIDLTQHEFGKRIGIKPNSISLIESGNRNASEQVILSTCREFNVNEDWLRTGEGDMFIPNPASELEALAKKYDLSHDARVLVEEFVRLKPEMQQVFIDFARKAAESFRSGPAPAAGKDISVSSTVEQEGTELDLAAKVAMLERQNQEKDKQLQELAAEVAAIKEDGAGLEAAAELSAWPSASAGSPSLTQKAKK